jgi:hypothetical protein
LGRDEGQRAKKLHNWDDNEHGEGRKSETVQSNCFRSLRVNVNPDNVLAKRLCDVGTSAIKRYMMNKQKAKYKVGICSHLGTDLHADA